MATFYLYKVINKKADIGMENRTNVTLSRRSEESFEKWTKMHNPTRDLTINKIGIIEAENYAMAIGMSQTLTKTIIKASPIKITNL